MSRRWLSTTLALLVAAGGLPGWCADGFTIQQQDASNTVAITVESGSSAGVKENLIEVDDAAGFRTPVWKQSFRGKTFHWDALQAGLAPGIAYWVRLNGRGAAQRFRLMEKTELGMGANCAGLRQSWEVIGRPIVERRSNLRWLAEQQRWAANPPNRPEGLNIYFVELFLRSGLEWAQSCDDLNFYDEASQYYMTMLQQTMPLGVTERRPQADAKTGMMAERTFPAGGQLVGDLDLGQAQWLYPAAKLARLISLLPAGRRSSNMRQFAADFTGFLVEEQVLRFLYRPGRPAPGGGPDISRVAVWQATLSGVKGKRAWDTAMSDVDLWLLASSAEVLGAHANDPELVNMSDDSAQRLRAALEVGIRVFRSKRTLYPDTVDLQGRRVGSATYFNGDYDGYDDLAFSAVSGPDYPAADKKRAKPNIPWDTSHAYRLPVFMRALYENRKATGVDFPSLDEMRLLTNQYVYRVFNGDFARPLLRNYLDGSDTWFRVDPANGSGYPPSTYCDDKVPNRPCEAPGNVVGWGLLSFVNPDLARLEKSLIELGLSTDADAVQFRERHYTYVWPYGLVSQNGKNVYSDTLSLVIADNSAMLADSPDQRK